MSCGAAEESVVWNGSCRGAVRAQRAPLTLVCASVQLQNEEEPGEAVPVVNDAPPPYSSISAESTGTLTWGRVGLLCCLWLLSPSMAGTAAPSQTAGIRIDPHSLLVLVVWEMQFGRIHLMSSHQGMFKLQFTVFSVN